MGVRWGGLVFHLNGWQSMSGGNRNTLRSNALKCPLTTKPIPLTVIVMERKGRSVMLEREPVDTLRRSRASWRPL
eukprot:scaffold7119_cov119-Skeletonema_marinoi.AAC.3